MWQSFLRTTTHTIVQPVQVKHNRHAAAPPNNNNAKEEHQAATQPQLHTHIYAHEVRTLEKVSWDRPVLSMRI